jgi:hypothetical protein
MDYIGGIAHLGFFSSKLKQKKEKKKEKRKKNLRNRPKRLKN